MGRRGPPSKGQAKGRAPAVVSLLPIPEPPEGDAPIVDVVEVPDPPANLLPETVGSWDAYWRSVVAKASDVVDLPALRRLFVYYDEWQRAVDAYRAQRLVEGSMGQPRLSPFADVFTKLEGHINRLENEMGLTPMARVKLGIAIAIGRKSVAELNAMASGGEPPHADEAKRRDKAAETQAAVEAAALSEWEDA